MVIKLLLTISKLIIAGYFYYGGLIFLAFSIFGQSLQLAIAGIVCCIIGLAGIVVSAIHAAAPNFNEINNE